jgi:hypothetical protein
MRPVEAIARRRLNCRGPPQARGRSRYGGLELRAAIANRTSLRSRASSTTPASSSTQHCRAATAPGRTSKRLFVGSNDGARVNTVFVSLLASARLHDIEPLAYTRNIFFFLPAWPRRRVLELAPAYWKKTLEQADTQEKLAANVFRRVVL